ncbi:hypothetical protein DFH11DRAFT_1609803 [Phellopilus nigrolimitatus]|nr:hypothetical protein DFH11DRAFT_1609803 [Phellopilus nigrolimitatus]
MDAGTTGLLESVTQKTLHAQNFSRASSQASHVLTDLLSRYVSLVATTCAQYAEHAGRASVSIGDAMLALDELGVSVDELADYAEGEGRELSRYAGSTSRRAEELALLKDTLAEGRRLDQDDALALVYAQMPEIGIVEGEESDEEVDEEMVENYTRDAHVNGDVVMPNGKADVRMVTPTLPPSPISNPSSPSRKRARLANWNPPSHIPDFLPPYPMSSTADASPPPSPSPHIKTEAEMMLPPPLSATERERGRLPTPPPQQLSTATSAADYLTPVPYSMSSLSSVSPTHLPDRILCSPLNTQSAHAIQLQIRKHETPAVTPTLVTAYHHVLTHPPPPHPSTNPARHRVALAMLSQAYNAPRWTAADTLFANGAGPRPRVVAPAPTHPIPLSVGKAKDEQLQLMPPSTSRTVMVNETVVPLSHQPTSRIPDIARVILPLPVFHRVTRIIPPPPLNNSASGEKFIYGPGVPAPWNSNSLNQLAGAGPTAQSSKGKGKDAQANGKVKPDDADDRERERERDKDKEENTLPDATLFATWDWEQHDFRLPLAPNKRGRTLGSFSLGPVGGPGGLEGGVEARGPSRKNSKARLDWRG